MAAHVTLTLDTTAPAGVTLSIDGGASFSVDPEGDVVLSIGTSDGDTTGYSVKIYGDVDDAFATAEYRALEANAPWVSFAATKNVRMSSGDGLKTVRIKIRDDVLNESGEVTDTITLDTVVPIVTTSGLSAARLSKVAGARVRTFNHQADAGFEEYKVKVVPATNSIHTAGTLIGTANGSANVSGSAGGYPATTNIQTTIDGRDLEAASAGDGAKIVKVFVREVSGGWST